MNKRIILLLLIFSFGWISFAEVNFSHFQKYFRSGISYSEKQRIIKQKVCLQKYKYAYPKPIHYKGVQIPNVFIDESIIRDPELRYKVSCYLMNKLDLGIKFEITDYESFVILNKEIIGECIYYLCHVDYGRIHKQLNSGCNKLLNDKLIQDELDKIKERLKKENSLFLYY